MASGARLLSHTTNSWLREWFTSETATRVVKAWSAKRYNSTRFNSSFIPLCQYTVKGPIHRRILSCKVFPQGSSTRPQRLVPRTCPQGRKFRLGQKGETLATLWNSESPNNFSFCFFGLRAPSALSCLRTLRSGAISPSMEKTWGHTRSKENMQHIILNNVWRGWII